TAVVGPTRPDLTIIFDLPPELGLRRAAERKRQSVNGQAGEKALDRFEMMNMAFHRSLREEFLAIAKAEPERCAVIDASRDVQRVADDTWTVVRQRLNL